MVVDPLDLSRVHVGVIRSFVGRDLLKFVSYGKIENCAPSFSFLLL